MLDNLLLMYGLKKFDKRLTNKLFSNLTLMSLCFFIAQVILIIRPKENISLTSIKAMLCFTTISSFISYIYITKKSSILLNLRIKLENYQNNLSKFESNYSTTNSTILAIIVVISVTVLTFLFRNNYHHMKKVFEEPIEHLKYKKFLQINTDLSLIFNCTFNYGWKVIMRLIHYNIYKQYLSILKLFNKQLERRIGIPTENVIHSTHRVLIDFIHIKDTIDKNMNFVNYFIKIDIVIFFIFYLSLCIDSLIVLNLYAFLILLCLILVFYSYYYFLQLISNEVKFNENLIKTFVSSWENNIDNELIEVNWSVLKRTSDMFVSPYVIHI